MVLKVSEWLWWATQFVLKKLLCLFVHNCADGSILFCWPVEYCMSARNFSNQRSCKPFPGNISHENTTFWMRCTSTEILDNFPYRTLARRRILLKIHIGRSEGMNPDLNIDCLNTRSCQNILMWWKANSLVLDMGWTPWHCLKRPGWLPVALLGCCYPGPFHRWSGECSEWQEKIWRRLGSDIMSSSLRKRACEINLHFPWRKYDAIKRKVCGYTLNYWYDKA